MNWVNLHGLDWAPVVLGGVQSGLFLLALLVAFRKLEDSAAKAKIDRVVSLYSSYTSAGYATLRVLVDPEETDEVIREFDREKNITDSRQRTGEQGQEVRSRIIKKLIELLGERKEKDAIFRLLGHYLVVVGCVNSGSCDGRAAFELYGNDLLIDFLPLACGVLERDAKAWKDKEVRDAPIVKFLVANGMTEKDFLCEYQRVLARNVAHSSG